MSDDLNQTQVECKSKEPTTIPELLASIFKLCGASDELTVDLMGGIFSSKKDGKQ